MASISSLVNAERQVTISSGEMYPECGISRRMSVTRLGADKNSFRITGNGNGMWMSRRCRRCRADPPRNESEMAGALRSTARSCNHFSTTNVFCIAAMTISSCELGRVKAISHIRSLCPSAAKMSSPSPHFEVKEGDCFITIGNGGQAASFLLTGIRLVQRIRRSRRSGDRNTAYRHF
jgi:hypothetical protein